jgi:tRNA(His) 5'-end guanylyltransferase
MKAEVLDARMRALEWFHALRFPEGSWVILRLDGRGFSRLTEARFEKPFDAAFHAHMVEAATAVLVDLGGLYAYTESDEISVLLPRGWSLFGRELEKTITVSAGLVSGVFSLACGLPAAFDARACLAATDEQVVDYFRWRQADAARCALNGWCYWTLRKAGANSAEATRELEGKGNAAKNELLFRSGVNFNDVPLWQRRGTGVSWREVPHEGRDPVREVAVPSTRRRPFADAALPLGEAYGRMIEGLMSGQAREA